LIESRKKEKNRVFDNGGAQTEREREREKSGRYLICQNGIYSNGI